MSVIEFLIWAGVGAAATTPHVRLLILAFHDEIKPPRRGKGKRMRVAQARSADARA